MGGSQGCFIGGFGESGDQVNISVKRFLERGLGAAGARIGANLKLRNNG
jgi:hypothetical protein